MKSLLWYRHIGAVGAALILAGCAARKTEQAPVPVAPAAPPPPVACAPADPGSRLVGTWQSNTRPRGVAGDFRALIVLSADGSMHYDTQLKIGKRIRPGLRESGCWKQADGIVVLQTTKSNGELVDTDDPIYQNRYRIEKADAARLALRELRSGGQVIAARRMPTGYRLPD
ncbi:hypothetical protein [Bordetella sp. BOR01]|uniref:hypothetical protein n=1 Tax=Bordetella sp. BOR01 TaxID=2854779 RepID=UPI001C45A66E|nr:hypothetical protein [Bordetella sp. BOR01]MBV7484328.1 hypothetical protein [Bordetella sp. BOR01]